MLFKRFDKEELLAPFAAHCFSHAPEDPNSACAQGFSNFKTQLSRCLIAIDCKETIADERHSRLPERRWANSTVEIRTKERKQRAQSWSLRSKNDSFACANACVSVCVDEDVKVP